MKVCGAKTRGGKECQRAPMANGRCSNHGGLSPGAPLTAGGRHSKYLPQRLAARFAEAQKDAELTSVASEIALIDTRLSELFERLDTTETSAAWAAAYKLYKESKGPDKMKAYAADKALGDVLEKGLADVAAWNEICGLVEMRRKCAETEGKRLAQLDQFVTAKQANVLMAAIVKLVTENVADADARRRIAAGLAELAGPGDKPGHLGVH